MSAARGRRLTHRLLLALAVTVATLAGSPASGPAEAAGAGQYSAPEWLPLRAAAGGGELRVGCTYKSPYLPQRICDDPSTGAQSYHPYWALDLAVNQGGAPVFAAGAGQVHVGGVSSSYGNHVWIDHGGYGRTLYAHLASITVANNSWVDQNTQLGTVGNTGSTGGTYHLHYEYNDSSGGWGRSGSPNDPGALKACHGSSLVSYGGWQGLQWGTRWVHSDGTGCGGSSGGGPIALTGAVTTTAASGYYVGASIRHRFTVKNTTGSPITMRPFALALRDPYGVNYDQLCAADVTLAAGATTTCDVSTSWGSVGTYRIWPAWQGADGTWHDVAAATTFDLAPPPPILATQAVDSSAASGFYAGAPIRQRFTVKNTTDAPITMRPFILALRDPYGDNYDKTCAADLTLAPGASTSCDLTNSWGSVGTYRIWPAWQDTAGTWHDIAPTTTFELAPPPPVLAVEPVTTSAPYGFYVGAPIRHRFVVKNTTGSPIIMRPFALALRDPFGDNYDKACAADLTLAPGASTTCDLTHSWGSVGSYRIWPVWQGTDGTWHDIAPVTTFDLATAPRIINTARPVITGALRVGSRLTASGGSWIPSGHTLSYQWLANGAVIRGATTSTYTPRTAVRGKRISVRVTASMAGYSPVSATSLRTGRVP